MQFPDELNKLLSQFHADIELFPSSFEIFIKDVIAHLSREEQKTVKQFLQS